MNEEATEWMDGGILLIFVLIKYIIISLDLRGGVEGIIVCIKLLLLLLLFPFLNSLRLGNLEFPDWSGRCTDPMCNKH